MSEIKTVYAYLRCSSSKQETSIPDQKKTVLPFIKSQKWKLLGTYIDEGKSGSVNPQKRQAFHDLMSEIDKGKADAVVCLDTSRFGRLDNIESAEFKSRLRSADTILITLQDGTYDFSKSTDRIMSSLKEEGNNDYAKKISDKSLPAKLKRLQDGNVCSVGGTIPYGLAKFVIDPHGNEHTIKRTDRFQIPKQWHRPTYILGDADEVETVKFMFEQLLKKDVSYSSIAEELNKKGIPSPSGGKWRDVTIKVMLRNPIYVGASYIGKSESGKFNRASGIPKYDAVKKQNQKPDLIIWNQFEAIIKKNDWEKVQQIMLNRAENHHKPKSSGNEYALTGVLVCGGCGRKMQGHTNPQLKAGKQVRYRCSCRPALTPECGGQVKGHEILPIVLEAVKDKLIELTKPQYKKFVNQNKKKLTKIDNQIEKIKRRLKLTDDDELFVEMQHELKELREAKANIETGTIDVPDGFTQVDENTKIRTEHLTSDSFSSAIIRKVFIDKAKSLILIDDKPVEVSVFRQALKQMGLQVTIYFKDAGAEKKYGRWILDKAACKLDFIDINSECGLHNESDTEKTETLRCL